VQENKAAEIRSLDVRFHESGRLRKILHDVAAL